MAKVLSPGAVGLKFGGTPNRPSQPETAIIGTLAKIQDNNALSAAGGPIVPDAWDRTYNAAAIYSNNDRTAALANGHNLLSTTAHLSGATGRFYVEITINSLGPTDDFDLFIGSADILHYVTLYTDGYLYDSSGFSGTYAHLAFTDGDVVGIAYNAADNLVWIRVNNGYWNTGSGDDPATDIGGIPGLGDIEILPNTPIHLGVHSYENGNGVTINTGTVAWATVSPSEYSAWWISEVTGTLGSTEIDDTLSAAGTVASSTIVGALNVTQADQVLSATAGLIVYGTLTASQAAHTIVASGTVVVDGTLIASQAAQTLAAQAGPVVRGTLAIGEADDTLAATAAIDATATLNLAQAAQILAATATVADAPGVEADLAEAADASELANAVSDVTADAIETSASAVDDLDAVTDVATAVVEATDARDELDAAVGALVLFGTVDETAVALDQFDATVEAVEVPVDGGGAYYPPQQRPFPVVGRGYGVLPQFEGEAHGVVGTVAKGAAQLLVHATAMGACGQAGNAAVVLKGLSVTGQGAVGARGEGEGVIVKFSGSATGRHDDDEAAVIAILLAA